MSVLLTIVLAAGLARADTPLDGLSAPLRARFEAAEAAWGQGDLAAAEAAFSEVVDGAPTFDRAWRRRCGVRLAQQQPGGALADCRQAVELRDGHENRTALALALLHHDALPEARRIVDQVLAEAPDYEPAHTARCAWAAAARHRQGLDTCATHLEAVVPNTAGAYYYRALALIEAGNLPLARDVLLAAQQEGLADDLLTQAADRLAEVAVQVRELHERRLAAAPKGRNADGLSLPDLVPLLVAAALVLAVAVLWFGKDEAPPPEA